MSSKKVAQVITLAAIQAERSAIQAEKDKLAVREQAAAAREVEIKRIAMEKLGATLDTFPSQIKAITGEDVSIAGVISYLKRREAGTLGSLANTGGSNGGNTAKRLTPEEDTAVRAAMFQREVNRALELPMETISSICAKFGISGQSADTRKPKTPEELALLKSAIDAAKAAMPAPAAVPA